MAEKLNIQLKDIFINDKADKYIPSKELIKALEIAYALKRPLLISGEPGTGKSEFANWVADTLAHMNKNFLNMPLVYNTKSTSVSQDLFYFYDAVSHFRENQTHMERNVVANQSISTTQSLDNDATLTKKKSVLTTQVDTDYVRTTEDFIELKALGLAFARAIGSKKAFENQGFFAAKNLNEEPEGTVVLIDEVDKAPRDFPNDLLNEIEKYEFEIRELNKKVRVDPDQRKHLIVILTSNFEKNLPEAFLRRCIYFHIEFPGRQTLIDILTSRLGIEKKDLEQIGKRVDDFLELRRVDFQKKPSTAELIDFVRAIKDEGLLGKSLRTSDGSWDKNSELLKFIPVLLKKREDMLLFVNR
jgi:MoxR-like ATPase